MHLIEPEDLVQPPLIISAECEEHEVVKLPGTVTDEIGQQCRRFETQVLEHRHQRFLFGYHLYVRLTAAEFERLHHGSACQVAA